MVNCFTYIYLHIYVYVTIITKVIEAMYLRRRRIERVPGRGWRKDRKRGNAIVIFN